MERQEKAQVERADRLGYVSHIFQLHYTHREKRIVFHANSDCWCDTHNVGVNGFGDVKRRRGCLSLLCE